MPEIIAMNGSPRQDGFSSQLLREVLRGAESAGASTKVYDLNAPDFRGCQGCLYCRTHPTCCIEDSFKPFYEEIGEARGIVFGSGIYFGDVTGQAMMGMDRLFPMLGGQSFSPRHPGKAVVQVLAQGDGDAERFGGAISRLTTFFHTFGWRVQETILAAGASGPGYALPEQLKQKAFAAGQTIAGK